MEIKNLSIQALMRAGQLEKALLKLDELPKETSWKNSLTLRCLRLLKRNKDALNLAETLVASNTTDVDELRFSAITFSENGKTKEAINIFEKLCKNHPNNPHIHIDFGTILSAENTFDKAEEHLSKGLKIQPANVSAYSQLARIYCRTGRIEKGLEHYHRAALLEPNNTKHLQRIAYWSNYSEKTTQQSNFHIARLWANKTYPDSQHGSNTWRDANPTKPLKIGFVSADFCAHAVSFFILPLLKNIDKKQFHVFAYSDVKKPDHITEEIKKHCDNWHDASQQNNDTLRAQIGADQLDILIDLSGHTANNRLDVFTQHVAPLQISWLGYPSTTGLNSINYRITDAIADPVADIDYYSEELIRLDSGFLCFEPLKTAPEIKLDKKGKITRFGSFNNLAKLSSLTYDSWAAVLHKVPKSTLYLKRQQLINESAKQHVINEFSKRGISEDRLILKTSKAKVEQHLEEYNNFDIALDTTPYNGTTTTLEALWMGKPVITLSGGTHASRVSASILHRVKLDDLVTNSIEEFANTAQALSKDDKRLKDIANSIRQTMTDSPLLNYAVFTKSFSDALREKWVAWCDKRNKEDGFQTDEKIIGQSEDK